ncbi:MAG: hypothetical protein NT013_17525 [Planctomycetia bacterium]|nr:hypothetical protein [Planctomycetia bacterium]
MPTIPNHHEWSELPQWIPPPRLFAVLVVCAWLSLSIERSLGAQDEPTERDQQHRLTLKQVDELLEKTRLLREEFDQQDQERTKRADAERQQQKQRSYYWKLTISSLLVLSSIAYRRLTNTKR